MLHIERTGLRNLQPNFLQGTGNLSHILRRLALKVFD